jgi:hypothetical protein
LLILARRLWFNGGRISVVQIRVTPKTRNPFTLKTLSISGVTWKWHFLNHAATAANVNDTLVFERLFLAAFAVMARIRTVFADKDYDAER